MSAVLDDRLEIRSMGSGDIEVVVQIEESAYRYPWNANVFTDCLQAGYVGRVCSRNNEVAGYGVMSVGAGECHILNLCVHPRHQRQSIGTHLMLDLLAIAQRSKTHMCFLEVRVSNQSAYTLYHGLGFNEVGIRKNYYPGIKGREDAFVLAKVID